MRGTSLEIVIPLPNGGSLRCGPGENHEHGAYIRICDADGIEIIYWDKAEWSETPELVIGAVFASALTSIDELLAQTGRSQIVGVIGNDETNETTQRLTAQSFIGGV